MKHPRRFFLGLCVICMLLVSACTSTPRVLAPYHVALALEDNDEILLALQMPDPTQEPPEPTAIPTPEPTAEPTPEPTPEPTVKPTKKPERTAQPSKTQTPSEQANGAAAQKEETKPAAKSDAYSLDALKLAAKVAYLEAKGKGEETYRAVLSVIYNRCKSSKFGKGETSISTEVYRKSQFSVIGHSKFETMEPPEEIVEYAYDVFCNGNTNVPAGVLFFRASRLGQSWGSKKYYKTIGGNAFYYGS